MARRNPHGPYRRKAPTRGGARLGAGRKVVDEELIGLLHKCETAREKDADLSPEEKATVKLLHKKLVGILTDPGRHAQTQATIVRTLLDEVTGKIPDKLQAEIDQVTVQIVKKERLPLPAAPPAPATAGEGTPAPRLEAPSPAEQTEEVTGGPRGGRIFPDRMLE